MASASAYSIIISHSRTLKLLGSSSALKSLNNPSPPIFTRNSFSSKLTAGFRSKLTICSVAQATPSEAELQESSSLSPPALNKSWSEFASKVSGEWDGFGADFTTEGKPTELPESVVPEAYREWEVKVFDWQTQCPTLADPQNFHISYRSIKLLPTVGCEADAATIYSSDERNVAVQENNNVLNFVYQSTGCYVALWLLQSEPYKVLELEHCLINPRDKESRVRVIQILRLEDSKLKLQKIRVFCEQWYGPFRNGDQLGGCAIRDSAFASTAALNVSDVAGSWESLDALARYNSSQNKLFQELAGSSKHNIVRNEQDLIALPRQLWCSLKESGDGNTYAEVGWLLDNEFAISSRCIFSSDCQLKETAVRHETAARN